MPARPRFSWLVIAAAASAVACQDAPTGPGATSLRSSDTPSRATYTSSTTSSSSSSTTSSSSTSSTSSTSGSRTVIRLSVSATGTAVATASASVNPRVDTELITSDGHRFFIPANSICRPDVSGYGPAYWDQPCTTATNPIVFSFSARSVDGHPRFDLAPDVRFSPAKVVTTTLKDAAAAATPGSVIYYCQLAACVDESLGDPSLVTTRNTTNGTVSRRLKHFSGYLVGYGRTGSSGAQ